MKKSRFVLGITGASGSIYGLTLANQIVRSGHHLTILISTAGFEVIRHETGLDWRGAEAETGALIRNHFEANENQVRFFAQDNFLAPVASGSSSPEAVIICPCTMGTMARIACGNSGTLLERCADVMLKERRNLVLVPRETPLNQIHLKNMLKLSRIGVMIVPAMPAFYNQPESLDDMVNFVVGKVMDQLGLEHNLYRRWGRQPGEE